MTPDKEGPSCPHSHCLLERPGWQCVPRGCVSTDQSPCGWGWHPGQTPRPVHCGSHPNFSAVISQLAGVCFEVILVSRAVGNDTFSFIPENGLLPSLHTGKVLWLVVRMRVKGETKVTSKWIS